jgi:hypothetical protein
MITERQVELLAKRLFVLKPDEKRLNELRLWRDIVSMIKNEFVPRTLRHVFEEECE